MAHFAKLNDNNVVEQIIVIDNEFAQTEQLGIDYITNKLKLEGTWVQTSYNANLRGKYAAVTDIYDSEQDVFIFNTAYWEEQKAIKEAQKLEKENAIEAEKLKKEAIASKIGLTLEELTEILK
jgi:hypothetical protein